MSPHQITHVIFDNDGLLLDTEVIYTEITKQILEPFGLTFPWEVKSQLMGIREREGVEILLRLTEAPLTVDEYIAKKADIQEREFEKTKLMPGALSLVETLKKKGIPMAVGTSSARNVFEMKSKKLQDFYTNFHSIVCGDEVSQGKPSPDIFLECLSRFPTPPHPANCLVFEDAWNGVLAARAAGMQVVWIPDERTDVSIAATNEEVKVLASLTEFNPKLFGL